MDVWSQSKMFRIAVEIFEDNGSVGKVGRVFREGKVGNSCDILRGISFLGAIGNAAPMWRVFIILPKAAYIGRFLNNNRLQPRFPLAFYGR
jgi:hypothetical protein